jgi:hypothetical protein
VCARFSRVECSALQGLLTKEPRSRLTAAEALEHRWLTGHACADAATLKHAHVRAAALAAASPMPVRSCRGAFNDSSES